MYEDDITPDDLFNHGSDLTTVYRDPGALVMRAEYAINFGSFTGTARALLSQDGSKGHVELEIHESPVGPFKMTLEAPRDTIDNAKDYASEHNVVPRVMSFLEKRFGARPVIQHLLRG